MVQLLGRSRMRCLACRSAITPSELRSRLLCETWAGCEQVCAAGGLVCCSRIDCENRSCFLRGLLERASSPLRSPLPLPTTGNCRNLGSAKAGAALVFQPAPALRRRPRLVVVALRSLTACASAVVSVSSPSAGCPKCAFGSVREGLVAHNSADGVFSLSVSGSAGSGDGPVLCCSLGS